ncbi:MAG TPA: NADH-quinone oxidoreductase subunit NuoF [Candidatus Omnitrophota bacterium]|nr:NADH-quinone oxidoreductase subunit NuoF [Candidatus Omnitrophota bacterium]
MIKRIFIRDTNSSSADKARDFCNVLRNQLREKQMDEKVQLIRAADMGVYNQGIVMRILPDDLLYGQVEEKDIPRIVSETICGGKRLNDLMCHHAARQCRIVLRNCGVVDPESIEDYIAQDGYQALAKVLEQNDPEKVLAELKTSGLRGRGGAGYPTWLKWNLARNVKESQKYVICNGDEGDPGAYMDRSVLEGDPYSVIEGLTIAGFVTGASKGYFYIRAEYPLAIERIQKAIDQAYACGLLGENILGSTFRFDAEVRLGAGAFVCGEETALIASIEGKRGYPRPRPPYPSTQGLWGKPTVINNVETLANISPIILKSGKWFAGIGTETSKGTKVFAVTGKVKNSGLVEVPMGTSIREIVFDIGGGAGSGKKVKAVQTGGPSGGVIPEDFFNTPVGYENLQKIGSIMGSGGMIVMDESDCMVDIAKFYLRFCVDESCGKCAPCRIGGTQLLNLLEKISDGKGEEAHLAALRRISFAMQKASLCGLGQTAPNPVLSTLNYFEDEYRTHVLEKRCPARKCGRLFRYSIIQEKCKRCGLCVRNCPSDAISGNREKGYVIDEAKCSRCGLCLETCKPNAILRG